RTDLERRLEEAFDLELLETAKARVRDRVAPQTWRAFELTAIDGLSGADVAGRLGMQGAAVFMAKSHVKKMIQEEIALLDPAGPCPRKAPPGRISAGCWTASCPPASRRRPWATSRRVRDARRPSSS